MLSLFGMSYSANQLWLTVGKSHILLLSNIVESNAAHSAAVADIPARKVYACDGVGESGLY